MYAISAQGLTKSFDGVRAVDGITLNIECGEIYGLVGKNGAGKSTLLKMIAGLTVPASGQVEVFGRDVLAQGRSLSLEPSGIGALIESPGLLERYSAMENLMAKALALGVVDARAQCQELLGLVGLEDSGDKACRHFSLGMKQRLAIALSLVGNPGVLLLDEPFNGLDPDTTRHLRRTLVALAKERGLTIMISSHVLDQLDRMVTRFGVISSGRLVREISAERLHEACTSAVRVVCEDSSRALAVLEQRLPRVRIHAEPDGAIMLSAAAGERNAPSCFGGSAAPASSGVPTTREVSRILREAGQDVVELSPVERDIEDYFVDLMDTSHDAYVVESGR